MEEKTSKKKKSVAMEVFSLVLILILGIITVSSATSGHRYIAGDPVPLYVNKIGPYANSMESYRYFDLSFCSSELASEEKEILVHAPYKFEFRVDFESKQLCKKSLKREDLAKFRDAIDKDYFFEMNLDDLPVWGFVGSKSWNDPYRSMPKLHTSLSFKIFYNGDRICDAVMHTYRSVDISEDKEMEVEFLYSVKWTKTSIPFERRMDRYILSLHYFSIMKSYIWVIVLTGFFAAILMRVLKNDLAKYAINDDLIIDQEEIGWKNIHGDVFRYPKHKSLLAASIGSGIRLLVVFSSMLVIGFLDVFPPYNQGKFVTALIVIYALASFLAGYTSTSFYCQLEGANWVKNLIMTEFLFSGPLFLMFCFLNAIASMHNANAAKSLGTIFVLLMWILLGSPLLVFGGIAGKNRNIGFEAPCKTTKCPREIPPLPWYKGIILKMFIAGILPFSMISIQLRYIFANLWGYKFYNMYGILFIVFLLLLLVTAFVTVALTYLQLASEDHRWWWRSFFYGGSAGLFVYGYCFDYYAQSGMSGFIQKSFFFGYMACLSYGIFLALGTVGFFASILFVRHIYGSVKCE
ncbi:Nonaspanin (TM9SF) protein [Dioscorea alata]|uniref:Nonaspanin (TM9SF) protein n=1 Tax=Dioscorea alata TaxID=55571 RepID=A0ACB7VZ03_DIOAL|nr:Nonaspanin (TM9SF) protein [Dioscorea alata]